MAKIDTDFKVGKPSARNWSSVLGYRPETDALVNIFGEMFAVMTIRSETDFDLANVGGLLFDELQQSYYGEFKQAVELSDFEECLRKVKARVDAILEREEQLSQTGVDLEMAVAVVKGNALYLGVVGESKVYIRRGDNFAEVGSALIDSEMMGFMRTGSMYLTEGDTVMLITSELAASVTSSKYKDIMDNFKLSDVPVIHGAALLVGYDRPEPVPATEHEILPSEAELNDEDEEAPVMAKQATKVDLADQEEDGQPEIVKPLGHVYPEDEDGNEIADDEPEEDEDELPTPVPARRVAVAGSAAAAGVAGASILDKVKPQLETAKTQLLGLFNKAKGKAMDMRNSRMQKSNIEEDDELDLDMPKSPAQERQARMAAARGEVPARTKRNSSAMTTVQSVIDGGVNWFKVNILGQTDRSQMYLRGGQGQRNWKALAIIGLIIVVVLFLGIRKVAADRDYQAQVLAAQGQVSDLGQRLDALNLRVTTLSIGSPDATQKTQVISDLGTLITDAQTLEQKPVFATEGKMKGDVDNIIDQAQAAEDQAGNIVAFTQPQVVADLGINFQNADLSHMTYSSGKIYVTDKGRGVVYSMGTTINSEATAYVSGLTNPTLIKAEPTGGDLVVVDDNADSSISTIDTSNGTLKRLAGMSKSKIGNLTAMDVWTNGALYSINPDLKALLKQDGVGTSFQLPNSASPWGTNPDFASAIDMAVDYQVYVLIRGKGLERFLSGEQDNFTLAGLLPTDATALDQATAFDITATNLYIADPLNKRIMEFSKSTTDATVLTFKQQFVYRGTGTTFTKIKDLVANEETKKLYVLDGTQVIRLDL